MATVTDYPQSFLVPFLQNVIDFNASLIPIPLGMVSGTLSGFAFENVDGTYTIFLGTDIVVGESAPISGTATEIVRRSTLDPFGVHYADITGSFPATGVYEAFRGGGRSSLRASSPAATSSRSTVRRASAPGAKPADRDLSGQRLRVRKHLRRYHPRGRRRYGRRRTRR